MVFVGVYKAVYDYTPSGEGELAIEEGDLLYILEKSTEDNWWKAKKKAANDDDEEPEGLVPNNYVEEAEPVSYAKALYDYSRQTDEELSFSEDATLKVYDSSDPGWTLVGLDGEYGFVPSNYIEETADAAAAPAKPPRPSQQLTPQPDSEAAYAAPTQSPAAAIAGLIQQKTGQNAAQHAPTPPQFTPEASDEEEAPQLPRRPPSAVSSPRASEPPGVMATPDYGARSRGLSEARAPSGYHLYNIHEMISHMGKNKKMPTALGVNLANGTIMISPEKSKEQREWTADKLTHHSVDGKHVFIELVKPSRSVDFHAGSKDTASEIVGYLSDLASVYRAEGLREVIAAGQAGAGGQKKGEMSFEFMAQGDDEVTVAVGDEVIILDDTASDDWWQVRRLKNGKEGVVPASYVKITGTVTSGAGSSGLNAGLSNVERNRREEERETREAARARKEEALPDRYSSLNSATTTSRSSGRRREGSRSNAEAPPKPNQHKVRSWTDRTGSFNVEAEFLGLKDNKIHLHKQNGVKIAVPVSKMSIEDIEYVERVTGQSLDDEKPLSDIKRRSTQRADQRDRTRQSSRSTSGAAIESQAPKYDWFDFFLQCGVNPQICERYSAAFDRDQMGQENLEDISPTLLRTLGLKEGDILRVMKHLDTKFSRQKPDPADAQASGEGGLFSGPGGMLRQNTRKARPAPAVANVDTVDPRAFEQDSIKEGNTSAPVQTPASAAASQKPGVSGFDDNAWDLRPARQEPTPAKVVSPSASGFATSRPPVNDLSGLSLLDEPLVPSKTAARPATASQSQTQSTGADRSFFDQLAQPTSPPSARQRPQPPSLNSQATGLIPPPPARPMSAPQNQSAVAPPPLQAQYTGFNAPQLARPGQSMTELGQQRFMQMQPTGFMYGPSNGLMPQQTGFQAPMQTGYPQFPQQGFQPQPFMQQQQQFINGQATASPFADPPRTPFQPLQQQQTGYGQMMMPQATGINTYLPPALQPQRTGPANGVMSQPTGFMPQQSFSPPPPPQIPQQQTPAPLVAQKTGPAPPVRFGTQHEAKPLVAQPTGRANLSKATPQNPFGF